MHKWVETLVDRASCTFTSNSCEDILPSITYEIESGCDGIALNKNGDAFAELRFLCTSPVHLTVMMDKLLVCLQEN
jgi:hypothetical protein